MEQTHGAPPPGVGKASSFSSYTRKQAKGGGAGGGGTGGAGAGASSYKMPGRERSSKRGPLTETQEAALLSQAASQAMIAARSILLSGGTQGTALSTAKAAAQSILLPKGDDGEMEASQKGIPFMGRRKAKRQAEVVASMALMSVKNAVQAHHEGSPADVRGLDGAAMLANPYSSAQPPAFVGPPSVTNSYRPNSSIGSSSVQMRERLQAGPASIPSSMMSDSPRGSVSTNNLPPRPHRSRGESWISNSPRVLEDGSTSQFNNMAPQDQGSSLPSRRPGDQTSQKDTEDETSTLQQVSTKSRLPDQMPMPRSRLKDVSVQESIEESRDPSRDPVYYSTSRRDEGEAADQNHGSFSTYSDGSHDDDDSLTFDSGTFASATVTEATQTETSTQLPPTPTRPANVRQLLGTSFDPFLYAIANVLYCGGPPRVSKASRPTSNEMLNIEKEIDLDNNKAGTHETSNQADPEDEVLRVVDVQDSASSVDTAEIVRELNLSSSDEEKNFFTKDPRPPASKNNIRESMEQVVLRALSVSGARQGEPGDEEEEEGGDAGEEVREEAEDEEDEEDDDEEDDDEEDDDDEETNVTQDRMTQVRMDSGEDDDESIGPRQLVIPTESESIQTFKPPTPTEKSEGNFKRRAQMLSRKMRFRNWVRKRKQNVNNSSAAAL